MNMHGVDLHKSYATISVRNDSGKEVSFLPRVKDFAGYVEKLGSEDAVVLEASSGSFFWADRIEAQGAICILIDAFWFRIIRDSWNKTDRRDAANLSLALWFALSSGEVKLPEVYKPSPAVRELRRVFGQWQLLNKQIRQLKNQVQGVLNESGVSDRTFGKWLAKAPAEAEEMLKKMTIPESSRTCLLMSLRLLKSVLKEKEVLKGELIRVGRPFEAQVKLLMSIRGVTPLIALAFLAEVGDISRFSSLRKLYSYLGVVPSVRSSGDTTRTGHINRKSRALARTIFTQAIPHLANSSPLLQQYYRDLVSRKGFGRARVAVLRRVFGIMRRMLLSNTPYRWLEPVLYEKKMRAYERDLKNIDDQQEAA